MHAVGLHSALAIRRERRRRAEAQRARERRCSLQSTESGLTSPHCSTGSLRRRRPAPQDNDVVSSVGMLHLGVVFLVLGLFLVGSGWLPDDVTSWSSIGSVSWFNELVCSGLFAIAIGAFLIGLHKYLTKTEDDALEEYVSKQLTRSRSGHRLERDAETGGMHTKHGRREREAAAGAADPLAAEHAHGFLNALNGDAAPPLEQIAEEEPLPERRAFNADTYRAAAPPPPGPPQYPAPAYMLKSRM